MDERQARSSYPAIPTVIDMPSAPTPAPAPAERPGVAQLFGLGLAASFSFFLAALAVCYADGSPLNESFQTALFIGGMSLGVIWPGFILLYAGGGISRLLDHWLLYRLRLREIESNEAIRQNEIDSNEMIRAREIEVGRQINLAQARLVAERQTVAAGALQIASARETPNGDHLLPGGPAVTVNGVRTSVDPVERIIFEAIMAAYGALDQDGYLSNTTRSPFSKRALGDTNYPEIVQRLSDPGRRCGVVGAPWVARLDEERRTWHVNIRAYPTPEDAFMALVGRRRL